MQKIDIKGAGAYKLQQSSNFSLFGKKFIIFLKCCHYHYYCQNCKNNHHNQ